MPELRTGGIEIGHVRALMMRSNLEGAAGSCRGLLEDEGDALTVQMSLALPLLLLYEGSIISVKMVEKKAAAAKAAAAAAGADSAGASAKPAE